MLAQTFVSCPCGARFVLTSADMNTYPPHEVASATSPYNAGGLSCRMKGEPIPLRGKREERPIWFVQVDLYKPSGKWYSGGVIEINANAYDSKEKILAAFWAKQNIVANGDRNYWTIVCDDLPESYNDKNYHTCWKMVLQVGRDSE